MHAKGSHAIDKPLQRGSQFPRAKGDEDFCPTRMSERHAVGRPGWL